MIVVLLLLFAAESAKQAFDEAAKALSTGNYIAAEKGFQQVLKLEPSNIGALGNLGVVYSRLNRTPDAIVVYQRALKIAPNEPSLLLNLALAHLKQDDYAAAKPLLAKAVQLRPDNAQARELLATTQVFTGDADKAIPMLIKIDTPGARYNLAIAYLKTGQKAEAQAAIEELFRSVSPAQANFLVGRAKYEATLFEEAASALEKAAQLDSQLPGVRRELGKTYISLRKSTEARTSLKAALEQNVEDDEAHYFLGGLLIQEGEIEEGVPHLERAQQSRPQFWGSYYYLGKAKLQRNQVTAAIKDLRKASELNPNESAVYYQLSRALKVAGRDEEAKKAAAQLAALRAKEHAKDAEALVVK